MWLGDPDVSTRRLARYCADRLCLWCLCGKANCQRALSCRGDEAECVGLMTFWLEALEEVRNAAPTFAEMERQIETPEELRLYRAWRKLLARAEAEAKTSPEAVEVLREALLRQIEALGAMSEAASPEPRANDDRTQRNASAS